jgi:hypothetical protein
MECGRLKRVSRFLKWTKMSSPTRALISGPGMRVWTLPVSREPLVDDGPHRGLVDRVALVLDGVALVRHHVPDRGDGGDPDMPGRRRCRRRERHEGEHPGAGRDQLPHPTTIDPFMSGWIRQM